MAPCYMYLYVVLFCFVNCIIFKYMSFKKRKKYKKNLVKALRRDMCIFQGSLCRGDKIAVLQTVLFKKTKIEKKSKKNQKHNKLHFNLVSFFIYFK